MTPSRATARYETILVPLDGSGQAETALSIAVALTKALGAHLVLMRVHEPPVMPMATPYEWDREVAERELDYLGAVATRLDSALGYRAETSLVTGHPADAIRRAARRTDNTLVVMSSHGRTGFSRFWMGSVADSVVRECRTPVLIVRLKADAKQVSNAAVGRVLVPLDGSSVAEAILPHAKWFCAATRASLELFRVIRPTEIPKVSPEVQEDALQAVLRETERGLRSVAERLNADGPKTEIEVAVRVHESPAEAIIDHAAANGIAAIALTTRGSGLARLVGGVADKVIRDGPPLILLIRPTESDLPAFPGRTLH